jgi:23S rRNA (guanine2445-N2)-methyltransferase / 23S rRNA (guanine2069-N7)-methyltransferase
LIAPVAAAGLLQFFATAPRGLAELLARELQTAGASEVRERAAGVRFRGSLETGYRACLWSRVASRVLLELDTLEAPDEQSFHRAVAARNWMADVDPARTLACEFTGTHPSITHSQFGALRLKDGICDRLRADTGTRPTIERTRPAVRVLAHASGSRITLYLDLAGEGLHRRGYRIESGAAPLRENLAAGVLLRARWDEAAQRGAEFLDPLCGAGTLVIEAALIAAARAPGLLRSYYGFLGWPGHDAALWDRLCDEARARAQSSIASRIRGSDADAGAVTAARANAQRAGVAALLEIEQQALRDARPAGPGRGLICTNPPYGERLGDAAQAATLHAELGAVLRERFAGWDAAILTMEGEAARALRLRSYRVHELSNGALPCRLLRIDLAAPGEADPAAARLERDARAAESDGARMFGNRLTKNLRHLGRSAQRAGVSCYRLYDADMPEYAFAIDRYVELESGAQHLLVQEYAAPRDVNPEAARRRRHEVLASLPRVLEVDAARIHLRLRQRQSGAAQYRRLGASEHAGPKTFAVEEAGLRFLVNLDDYLDTGLFLDHRLTRARLRARAAGQRVLNLFCYTATASVYAAAGGAVESLSLDLSNVYLEWATRNFGLNAIDQSRHRLERADCLQWLRGTDAERYDLIFLDPPTFSNSKRMQGVLDVQRDHVELIAHCMRRLSPGGMLVFSCNAQRFRLDARVGHDWLVRDVSAATLPFDFQRHQRIHRCFELQARPG